MPSLSPDPNLPSQFGHMVPQSGSLLPLAVAIYPLQVDVGLECCADTAVPVVQEDVPLPIYHSVAGCSPSDALTQTELRGYPNSQDLDRCLEEESLETPGIDERGY